MDPKKTDEVVNQPPQPGQPQPSQPVVTTPGKEPIPPTLQSFLNQPQSQKPVEAKHTHHFFRWILILLIIVLLVVAGVLGYYIFMGQPKASTSNVQTALPTIPAEPSPTPDPTAEWQTYESKELGYIIKYPSSYSAGKPISSETTNVTFTDSTSNKNSFSIHTYRGKNVETYYKKTHAWWLPASQENVSDVTINQVKGKKFTYTPIGDTGTMWDMVLLETDGVVYEFWINHTNDEQGLQIAHDAVNTFQVTKAEPTTSVSSESANVAP